MTTQAIMDFANALSSDRGLARGLAAALGGKPASQAAEAFASYAREQGFAVTGEDAAMLQAAAGDEAGRLSDDQLDAVAGGKWTPAEWRGRKLTW